jgi:hypothetical protein
MAQRIQQYRFLESAIIAIFLAVSYCLPNRAAAQPGVPDPIRSRVAFVPLSDWATYLILAFAAFGVIIGIMSVRAALSNSSWSLNDALSEEAELDLLDSNGRPILDASGKPLKSVRLVASSSRLIALLGLIGILSFFLANGLILLWQSAHGVKIDDQWQGFANYLLYGIVMFAPYVVNKFASIFESFAPRR